VLSYDDDLILLQGFSPHVSPFVQMRDLGSLLNQAGFSLTTIVSVEDGAWTHGL